MAQQSKLLGRNGVKKICVVCVQTCWCQSSQVFGRVCFCIRHECTECQACEGSLAWMLYWNNAYLYTVHADLCNHKGFAQSTVLQVALLAKHASSRAFFVAKIGEQVAWWKDDCLIDADADSIYNNFCWRGNKRRPWHCLPCSDFLAGCFLSSWFARHPQRLCCCFLSSWFARHPQRLCCWCQQLQRPMRGWWGKRKNGLAPWKLPTPLS